MTDFRALCAELVEKLDELNCHYNVPSQSAMIERALAALADEPAVPQPQPPAEGEVAELVDEARYLVRELRDQADDLNPSLELFGLIHQAAVNLARAADLLQRLSPPQPVPVSERLPGPEDCDAEWRCWWAHEADKDIGIAGKWVLLRFRGKATVYTHWLPAQALPLPGQEVEG